MTKEEMKDKYSAFITEISEILGLNKPVDILKLCATTDLFFQPLEKRIAELEAQIEKMKSDVMANIKWADKNCDNMWQKLVKMWNQWEIKENDRRRN